MHVGAHARAKLGFWSHESADNEVGGYSEGRRSLRARNRWTGVPKGGTDSNPDRRFPNEYFLPAAIAKVGVVFNLSVCVSANQKVVLETCLVVWTTM